MHLGHASETSLFRSAAWCSLQNTLALRKHIHGLLLSTVCCVLLLTVRVFCSECSYLPIVYGRFCVLMILVLCAQC